MTKNKVLKWRLSEKPTASSIAELVTIGVITKEEAKKLILDESEVSQSDIEAVKTELGLIRKMVLDLADKSGQTREIIRIIEREVPVYVKRYPDYTWTNPYVVYCSASAGIGNGGGLISASTILQNSVNNSVTNTASNLG